jgi:heterotetrameric sarcosine oxidase alpha subunit
MTQRFRLDYGGRIDRSRTLHFSFDGRTLEGHPGDTLASALLANGERFVGRSFKYHRPRGIVTAGPEEPCALVELRSGGRREPNTRATTAELFDGLEATSQNRWPSLAFDISAVNSLIGRFIPAGFYYKTFMWPASFWEKVYEPIIRRAAGLGRAASEPDPDEYEAMHAHCDVLVVGSGAAGLSAARAAGAAGARVILADQDFELGGGLLLEPAQDTWRQSMLDALSGMPEVRVLPRTTVFGFYEHGVLGAVERVADHLPAPPEHGVRQRVWTIRAKQTVLATGATERPIAFPDNDRPGVMLASAAMTYVHRFGVRPGERAVVFVNNDAAYDAAFAMHDAGLTVAAVIDVRKKDSKRARGAADRGITVRLGSQVIGVRGSRQIHGVVFRSLTGTAERVLDADLLCVSGGYNPAVQLQSHTRARLSWDNDIAAFVPGKPVEAERSAGSAAGVFGIARAAADGAKAGIEAAAALGFRDAPSFELPGPDGEIDPKVKAFWEVKARGKAFVDLQNDVTADDIRLAHREGYVHIEHAKRYTTHSMATDQGKTSGLLGVAVLAEARGESIEKVGVPTYRPYVSPVTWGAFAGRDVGHHLQPTRRTPLHHWHVRNHGIFLETGLWMRPLYYSATRETGWDPILREARAVRQAVGICDVSTLGKIDVQGRDAGTFLDRLYTNTFSTLAVGKARYGLMLREDGIMFDDGTTSRLAEHRYLMTTTTAKAAEVLAHMEFHHQTVWPELDVRYCTVTDQWAQMSVAGPKTRLVLQSCIEGLDLSNEAFPFMGVGDGTVAGCPVRLYRVSFSGEMAYEVATPAGYGERVWEAILEAGKPHGILPYGLEALGLLRIEKGHVAGPELNGQTTARDLGFEKMMKKKGDFIGRVNAERPRMLDSDRPRLVGIRAVDPSFERRLRGGAHIVDKPDSTASLGWATSITRSVELERWLGLAMIRSGPERIGQRLYATYPLKNEVVEVEVCSPHHVDPENLRVRA